MPDGTLNLTIPVTSSPGMTLPHATWNGIDYNNMGILIPMNVNPSYYINSQIIYDVNNGTDPQYSMTHTLNDYLISWGEFIVPPNDSTDQSLLASYRAQLQTIIETLIARPAFSGYMPLGFYLPIVTSESHNLYSSPAFFVLDPTKLVSNQIRFMFPEYVNPVIDLSHMYMWYCGWRCWPPVYFFKSLIYTWAIC